MLIVKDGLIARCFNRAICAVVIAASLGYARNTCCAQGFERSGPILAKANADAYVALCRFESYTPRELPNEYYGYTGGSFIVSEMRLPGTYVFHVLTSLKGNCGSSISIHLGLLKNSYYPQDLFARHGRFVLIYNAPPSVSRLPGQSVLLPVGDNVENSDIATGKDVGEKVVSLLIASLPDRYARYACLHFLKKVQSTNVVAAVVPYMNSPDLLVRVTALTCLITNQQVSAIPLAVRAYYFGTTDSSARFDLLNAFMSLNVSDAVPFLNLVLFAPSDGMRSSAMYDLGHLLDASSIPYFVLALRDPSRDGVAVNAFMTLPFMLKLKSAYHAKDYQDALSHVDKDSGPIYQWWADELSGRHLAADAQTPPAAKQSALATLDGLNKTLFEPYPALRETAIDLLVKKADKTTIPYLVLALQDPDGKVAYGAYQIAHRLTGIANSPVTAAAYTAGREPANAPLYAWWTDELKGKHLPPLPPRLPATMPVAH